MFKILSCVKCVSPANKGKVHLKVHLMHTNQDKRTLCTEMNCNAFLTNASFNGEFKHDNSNANIVV